MKKIKNQKIEYKWEIKVKILMKIFQIISIVNKKN